MSSGISLTRVTCRRLLATTAVLHLFLAIALFVVGRAGVAPALIDRDGIMGSFAADSYDYQGRAIEVTGLLRRGNVVAWATAPQPVHVKLLAVPFALLTPLFGYSILSAEPYNLVCYIAIVGIVFAMGRELSGHRAGVLAAAIVALWPTFLLHTMQLLKDPLFIAAVLAFLFCAITSLVRTYPRSAGASVTVVAVLLVLLLALVRFRFALLMIAVALLTLGLLILRQARERRLLLWNMAPALAVSLVAVLLLPFYSAHSSERTKRYLSDQPGPPKNVVDPAAQMPTLVRRINDPEPDRSTAKFARRISSVRSRFAAVHAESGSALDANAEFRNVNDLIRYVPRAMEIGLWAPFPYMWFSPGRRVANLGKLLSGVETLAVYLLQALAVMALVREPRRLALWLVFAIVVFGVTALAFVVPNVGAIYRFRYVFWILLVVAAMTGLNALLVARQRQWVGLKRPVISICVATLVAAVHGCSSLGQASHSHELDRVALNFALTNFTGTSFQAIYLSPNSSTGWQENVVAGSELQDGDTLNVRFDPNEKNVEWDMRVEGVDGHYAEWKNLKLDEFSEITLVFKLSPGPTAVAEVE